MLVAALPLFIVLVGYHRWRRICPLAFFSQIPVNLRRPGKKKVSAWLETNYYRVAFAIFFISLWLRLIATNGDGRAIAIFFILLSMVALVVGAIYTGKSWCNYLCPVSFVEKIYTEPHGLRETENSQCQKCSACKDFCPDINEENGYWKEINSPAKRFVYLLFPGVVFGFYFYYYLQAGTWDYYFGGSWTNEAGLVYRAFLPGHDAATAGFFFLPVVPRALAAALTLAVCALTSYLILHLAEPLIGRWLRQHDPESDAKRVRHVVFSIAAFIAFVIFYSFAGQPSLRKITFIPASHLVTIVVVLTATFFLIRRVRRTPKEFAEETLARNIVKRWKWPDIKAPRDLREAFLIHTIRSGESTREAARFVEVYKDALREILANGFITREEVHLLDNLRNQLRIKQSDHEAIMSSLAVEERAMLSDSSRHISAEKRLQLSTYSQALKKYLEKVLTNKDQPDDKFIVRLRSEYAVTKKEHSAIIDELLSGSSEVAAQLADELRTIERSTQTVNALELNRSPTNDYLADLLRRRRETAVESLIRGLTFSLPESSADKLRDGLCNEDESLRESILEELRETLPATIAERLIAAHNEQVLIQSSMPTLTDMLCARLQSVDPYVRAFSLLALSERGAASDRVLDAMRNDEHEIVRETTAQLSSPASNADLSLLQKMIALGSAPIFAKLAPSELAELARATREETFASGVDLCHEGDAGNEVFIVLKGEIDVIVNNGEEEIVNREQAGGFIGELAVLDPAPRSAGLRAGGDGAHVLRLDGNAFRQAIDAESSIATHVIRTLAHRLRESGK